MCQGKKYHIIFVLMMTQCVEMVSYNTRNTQNDKRNKKFYPDSHPDRIMKVTQWCQVLTQKTHSKTSETTALFQHRGTSL